MLVRRTKTTWSDHDGQLQFASFIAVSSMRIQHVCIYYQYVEIVLFIVTIYVVIHSWLHLRFFVVYHT